MSDWIEWHGGECPVPPETMVLVRYRSRGQTHEPCDAAHFSLGDCWWKHESWDGSYDIVAYRVVPSAPTEPANSGLNGSYYDLTMPDGRVVSCNDVIDALGLSFNRGEMFKAIWRLGRKPGVDERYDAEKIVYYAQRELTRVTRD